VDKQVSQQDMKNARTSGQYERIWTNTEKCVFCDLKDKYIIREENGIVLTTSLYPYIDGQLLAIPRRHIRSPKDLTTIEWDTIRKFGYLAKKLIRKVHGHKALWTLLREGGTGAGMSVVDHLHVHFIPFDNADLCSWNYRELQFTPLENAGLYQQLAEVTEKYSQKYAQKYLATDDLEFIIADAIIYRVDPDDGEIKILLQKRAANYKIPGSDYTLPGGHLTGKDQSMLSGLVRELEEEIALAPDKLSLLYSDITDGGTNSSRKRIWNTYIHELAETDFAKIKNTTVEADYVEWLSRREIKSIRTTAELRLRLELFFEKIVNGKQK
jgi:diadenosine tetraphosphate (Ap4A) HIT family hydrolase/8-oxo-dGTP pyrophosphatase MutT (NUDIX family)